MSLLKKLYQLLSVHQKRQALSLLLMMVVGMVLEMLGVGLVLPALSILTGSDGAQRYLPESWLLYLPDQHSAVIAGAGLLVMIYLLKAVFLSVLAFVQMRFAFRVQEEVSFRLFSYYMSQPYTFHTGRNSSGLLQNVIHEVSLLVGALTSLLTVVSEALVLVGLATLLLLVEPVGVLVVGSALAGAGLLFHRGTRSVVQHLGAARLHHEGRRVQHVQQGLGGIKDIKIFGREQYFLDAFRVHNRESSMVSATQASLQILPRPWLELVVVLALTLLSLFIIGRGQQQNLVPALGVFAAAAFRLLPSVNRILASAQAARFALPVVDALHAELSAAGAAVAALPRHEEGGQRQLCEAIELRKVSFCYPGSAQPALSDVNMHIHRGEMVGIIGASGAGKSTLVDLMLGLLEPACGQVLVDGRAICLNPRQWQDQVGYVPQTVYLSDDSLRNNIAFGVPPEQIDEAAVGRAVQHAQLGSLVASLPEGLNTSVGERGVRLSGGQRQRIGIARALYRDPPVLLLDEATSALDLRTEADVMATVMELRGQKTIIVISHRVESIRRCDRIFRIEHGAAHEVGHAVLDECGAR